MTSIQSFKDLDVWKKAHSLVITIYKITKKFPREELFGLTNQIRRSVVSITSNIAEGFGRSSYKEKINFYFISRGSLTETHNQLIIAKDIGYITEKEFDTIEILIIEVYKLCNGIIKSSRTHLDS